MVNRKRNIPITVRVTEREKELIDKKFKLSGEKTIVDFVVNSLIYSKIFKVDTADLKEVSYEINKVGTNINQITKRINETGNIYKADLEEINKRLTHLMNFTKKYYEVFSKFEEVCK